MRSIYFIFLTFFMLGSSEAVNRPLSKVVELLSSRYACSVQYPDSLRDRRTELKTWDSLAQALGDVFLHESWTLSRTGNQTQVTVVPANTGLGQIQQRRVDSREISSKAGGYRVDANSLLIGFGGDLSTAQRMAILNQFDLSFDPRVLEKPFVLAQVKDPSRQEEVMNQLKSRPGVSVSYNPIVVPAATESNIVVGLAEILVEDTFHDMQWGYRAVNAHVAHQGSQNRVPKIVVLDTGVNTSHEDLVDGRISNRDFNDALVADNDYNGHGTGVVGVLGATWNTKGITGLTDADVISIKVFDR